jgi:hypothetical protein
MNKEIEELKVKLGEISWLNTRNILRKLLSEKPTEVYSNLLKYGRYRSQVINNYKEPHAIDCVLPGEFHCRYYYTVEVALWLVNMFSTSPLTEVNGIEMKMNYALMRQDLNTVTVYYALIAWLTTDDYRLEKDSKFANVEVSTDLEYGLIQREPLAVSIFSSILLNTRNRECLLNKIDKRHQKYLKEYIKAAYRTEEQPHYRQIVET